MITRVQTIMFSAVTILLIGAGVANGVPFNNITIGDIDGFGRGNCLNMYSCNKSNTALCDSATYHLANLDGLGLLKEYDYLPDINLSCEQDVESGETECLRHVWWTNPYSGMPICAGASMYPGDDWTLRSAAETADSVVTSIGAVYYATSSGSKFTDMTLSRSFNASYPGVPFPTGLPSDPGDRTLVHNQPTFIFDFKVPTTAGGITPTMTELWLNMLFGDYEVGEMAFTITPHNNPANALTIDPNKQKMPDQDGLIQPVFQNLLQFFTFSQLFTTVTINGTTYYYCHLVVDVLDGSEVTNNPDTPGEPYTAYDFCQLSLTPPFCILRVGATRPYLTIQSAINAAANGCTVIVDPGTYNENISFGGKNIVVQSVTPTDSACVTSTIIDGTGTTSVVTFSGTETGRCVLSGFTVTGGNATNGGAVNGGTGTKANINNCIIQSNNATNFGGGLYRCNGPILNCNITTNTAVYGGGLQNCNGKIQDSYITSNSGTYGGGMGTCAGKISNCTIESNTATYGGGLYYCNGTIDSCEVNTNTASNSGGGLYFCTGTISNSTIQGNIASSAGGGLAWCTGNIKKCVLMSNDGGLQGGAGYYCNNFEQCAIWGNQADNFAAGLYFPTRVVNCEFGWNVVNLTTNDTGVCIHSTTAGTYYVQNTMAVNAGGINSISMKVNNSATVVNNIAYNPNDYTSLSAVARYCLIGGAPTTPDPRGNFYGSVNFEGIFDYRLRSTSVAINRGLTTLGITVDIEDLPRDATPDIGCHEYQP